MSAADPRVRAYADLLLDRSLGVRPGWQVLLVTTVEARAFAEELARGVARRGAYVLPRICFGAWYPLDVAWAEAAGEEVALRLAPLEQDVVDRVDGSIFVVAPADPPLDAEISPLAKKSLRAQLTFYRARGRAGQAPEVRCDFPTPWFARQAGLSLEQYEDVFYDACLRDWDAEAERMRPVLERFDRAEDVRIVGDGTALRLSLAGRSGAMDAGHVNVPGGEVFFCPVEDSAEGTIAFTEFPAVYVGREMNGIRLRFERGRIVDASADTNEAYLLETLDSDEGARRLGELGIGCNPGITRYMRNTLFDEKIDGTVHLALGNGIPEVGGVNESRIHWDIVKDLRMPGTRIELDGEVVQQDGGWLT